MAARPNWKILTVGAALAGLGITGTGIALADSGGDDTARVQPIEVTATQTADADRAATTEADQGIEGKAGATDQDSPDNTPDDVTPDDNTPDNDTPDDDTADDTPDDNTPDDDTADDTPDDN
ncbi:hypothetical protein [Saccharomonospora sp. NB11]|jgi:hypothetical protein|uniref:hypothetical protein n=1 Tax=Saccharomonospora sp. NB11 TaxID=1642298 RepID=UPI0018D083F9|nr:hypothetical protein [Saccharomonospora sp. NB11]